MKFNLPCPGCGNTTLHLSRCRTIQESFIKHFTIFNICRCTSCNWRGQLSNFRLFGLRPLIRTGVVLFALAASGLVLVKMFTS
ncbi:hypothetical protein KAR48_15415 [bacterium]|nr:hypothetical protein [bacterium]